LQRYPENNLFTLKRLIPIEDIERLPVKVIALFFFAILQGTKRYFQAAKIIFHGARFFFHGAKTNFSRMSLHNRSFFRNFAAKII